MEYIYFLKDIEIFPVIFNLVTLNIHLNLLLELSFLTKIIYTFFQ